MVSKFCLSLPHKILISVGVSWVDQAEFGPSDQSLDFTPSQGTTPAAIILHGSSALWKLISVWINWRAFVYVLPAQGLSVLSSLLPVLSKHLVTLLWRMALLCWQLLGHKRRRKASSHDPKLTLWKSGGEMAAQACSGSHQKARDLNSAWNISVH